MKNVTWSWFFGIVLLIVGISVFSFVIAYVIYLVNAFLFLHVVIEQGSSIIYGFVIQLIIAFILSLLTLSLSYRIFKKDNTVQFKKYFSLTHFRAVWRNLPKVRGKRIISDSEKIVLCENWRLSYYKGIIMFLFLIVPFSITFIIPFAYHNYFHNLYPENPQIFLLMNNIYTISVFMTVFSFFFTFFYMFGREYYKISEAEGIKIFFSETIKTGKICERNKKGFIPADKRNLILMDLWFIKLLIRSLDIKKFTIEERFGIREFTANLNLFKRYLMYSNKKNFLKFSTNLENTISALVDLSQPQVFLNNYYILKTDYDKARKGSESQFDTNKLYDINKGITINRLKGEIRTMQLNTIITFAVMVLILILFLLQLFVYHGITIPTIPTP